MLTFYDAFAGMGGIRLGMEMAGFRCVGSCEIDKATRRTYAANFGAEPRHADIRDVEFLPRGTTVLCGGFPCQSFSNLGRRRGFGDPNGNLFFELARLAEVSRPRALLFENVKGLASRDGGKTLSTILDTLGGLGYNVSYRVLDAEDFGLPQRRERIFIVGFRNKADLGAFRFPNGRPARRRRTLSSIMLGDVGREFDATRAMLAGYIRKLLDRGHGRGGRFLPAMRMRGQVGSTLVRDGSRLMVVDGTNIRRLSPREWARMQGFPDSFRLPDAKTQAYRQIGNSVPVPVVVAVARAMAKVINSAASQKDS
jgi:DNA (cytosine-5)-methyltransferase 1